MTDANMALVGSYDYRLVTLSVLIAMFASYTALDLAGRTTAARGRVRLAWLIGGATAMGVGIWSMHYIGMLAFSLPVPVLYDWPTVLLSLLAAVFAAAVALFIVSRQKMGWLRALTGYAIAGDVFLQPTAPDLVSCVRDRNFVGRAVAHVSFSGG